MYELGTLSLTRPLERGVRRPAAKPLRIMALHWKLQWREVTATKRSILRQFGNPLFKPAYVQRLLLYNLKHSSLCAIFVPKVNALGVNLVGKVVPYTEMPFLAVSVHYWLRKILAAPPHGRLT